jgi:hypothetical protein
MVDPNDNARNIDRYRKQLMALFSPIPHIRITAPKYGLEFIPWDAWKDDKNPTWWHGYNKVKHERDSFFEHATLWNVLNAAAGLCVMIGYLYREWFENHTVPRPILFFSDDYKGKDFMMKRSSFKLP